MGVGAAQPDLYPVIPLGPVVAEDRRLAPGIENDRVDVAVVVQIVERRAAAGEFHGQSIAALV